MIARSIASRLDFVVRLAGLFVGILLGQGSVFLVQTILVFNGQLSTTASFGLALAILSLIQWTADWGGLALLPRMAVQQAKFVRHWEASIGRMLIAAPVVAIQVVLAWFYQESDPLTAGMIAGGLAIAPIWAFNLSGYLDGHARNALSGPLAGLPWAGSAVMAYSLLGEGGSYHAGLLIGGAYSAGCAICVLLQYAVARQIEPLGGFLSATRQGILKYLGEGAVYCTAEFPNQLYGRLLLVVVSESLGRDVLGIYIYIRQVISATAQAIGLVKRVEFPRFSRVATRSPFHLFDLLMSQGLSLGMALALFGLSTVIALWSPQASPQFSKVAAYLPFFTAALPLWAVSATLGQVLILQSRVKLYSCIMLCSIGVSAAAIFALTGVLGLVFLALVDVVMFAGQAGAYYYAVFRRSYLA